MKCLLMIANGILVLIEFDRIFLNHVRIKSWYFERGTEITKFKE